MRQIRPSTPTRALGCKPEVRGELSSTDGARPKHGMENQGHPLEHRGARMERKI